MVIKTFAGAPEGQYHLSMADYMTPAQAAKQNWGPDVKGRTHTDNPHTLISTPLVDNTLVVSLLSTTILPFVEDVEDPLVWSIAPQRGAEAGSGSSMCCQNPCQRDGTSYIRRTFFSVGRWTTWYSRICKVIYIRELR